MRPFLRFFSSVKVAIALLIVIAVASILGTLIPQGRSAEEYAARYGGLAWAFTRLQLTSLFHSVWYLALLGLFALNLIVCTLVRLSPKIRRASRPHVGTDIRALLALKIRDRWKWAGTADEAAIRIERTLRKARYRVRTSREGGKISLFGRKRVGGIFGPEIVHAGLLVIIAGGLASGIGGFKTQIALKEGEAAPVPRAGFEIRLDKFTTEYYPDGSVKDWKSSVAVLEQGAVVLTREVEVNDPLSYEGFQFYQMSYGTDWDTVTLEVWAKKRSDPAFLKKMTLKPGDRAPLGDADRTEIFVRRFLPDFVLGEGNQAKTRSFEPNNPAVLIEGYRDGSKLFGGWIFARYPDIDQVRGAAEADLAFELKDYQAGAFSVLEAAKDPGVPLIWLGSLLVMAGLALAFYWPTWEIRAALEESQGKTDIALGGHAPKSRDRFQKEFASLAASLRRSS